LDVATGGCIVVLMTLLFVAAMIWAPKYGLINQFHLKKNNTESSSDI
jgi:manganese transport system permease protein